MGLPGATFQIFYEIPSLESPSCTADWRGLSAHQCCGMNLLGHILSCQCRVMQPAGGGGGWEAPSAFLSLRMGQNGVLLVYLVVC